MIPQTKDKSHYLIAFVGTQPDKLAEATQSMLRILNDMPIAEKQFQVAKNLLYANNT